MFEYLNYGYYILRRNSWMVDPRFYAKRFIDQEIEGPVFFLGTHGGGLTLVSRMIRRHERIVSVTGNNNYWSGADEMQVVFGPTLPFELSGIKHHLPKDNFHNGHTSWVYASKPLLEKYRNTEKDADLKNEKCLKGIIRYCLFRFGEKESNNIFVDKSQVLSVKLSFINELLRECNPKFVLVTRNPYASCYRAPVKSEGIRRLEGNFSRKELLEYASQHWGNTMSIALEDGRNMGNFVTVKFEDVLSRPREKIKKISRFIGIKFTDRMIPSEDDRVPFGSKYRDRWYPLREGVNKKYYRKIGRMDADIIERHCFPVAEELGYERRSFV
jgi:hypothetical protein